MAKTPSDRVFQLIKSLNGSEKRYFHIATTKDNGSKYLQLFAAMEEAPLFDDAVFQEAVYGKKRVEGKKFSELKSYLYDSICQQLVQYDASTSHEYTLRQWLLAVKSLYQRRLFHDCRYLLKKVQKMAENYEHFEVLLEVLHWEKLLTYADADIDYLDKNLADMQERESLYISQMSNLKAYEGLFYQLYLTIRKNPLHSEERSSLTERIIEHPLLASETACLSYRAKVWYYRIQALLQHQLRRMDQFYAQGKQLIAVMEEKPQWLKEDVSQYIAALSNFATSCGYQGCYDEMRQTLQKLRKVTPVTLDDKLKIHRQYFTNYFGLCINTGNFTEGLTVLNDHLSEVEQFDKQLFERSSFYFQYFYIYFGTGNLDKALHYLNEWLNQPRSAENQDLQSLARLLNLVVHFEMGNSLLVGSLLRSTQRLLQKSSQLNAFEQLFIQTIRQANQQTKRSSQRAVFSQGVEQLKTLTLRPEDKAMLRFFDFESWLESQVSSLTFEQVVQQRQLK
ncbi:MAG: hypothetical protein R2795_13455 [Saprospiraceae bacterium]